MLPIIILLLVATSIKADYWSERQKLIEADSQYAIGSSIKLSVKEEEVNKILMGYKLEEYNKGFDEPEVFWPAQSFLEVKDKIEASLVFNFIRKVPKGASLHSHDTAMASFEYVRELTNRAQLYACVHDGDHRLQLRFFEEPNQDCNWDLVENIRKQNASFDQYLVSQLTITKDNPFDVINTMWNEFIDSFMTINGMVGYRPVFVDYFYQVLKELYEDNVMYVEFRGVIPEVYELNGTTYNPEEIVGFYNDTLALFKKDYPDFHGARFIYAPNRMVDNSTMDDYVKIAKSLKKLYPEFLAGFDLVGQEDLGRPLRDFIPQLMDLSTEMPFFFHAGESDWFGTDTDFNIFDAVLLNTTRIGHAFALIKHPELLNIVKNKGIAIEVSPISNQVLRLVDDLRNHPANFLIANNYPVVICCDDPGIWGARGLSYDWYQTFMAMVSREADLRVLKQLAINSINYSAMGQEERTSAFVLWQQQWDKFLDLVLEQHPQDSNSVYNVSLI